MGESDSWRDTLFVWDGIMVIGDPNGKKKNERNFCWKGTWVGCEDCADAKRADIPKRGFGENVPSDMYFDVSGSIKPKEEKNSDASEYIVSITSGEGYDLEDAGQKKKHKDNVHIILLPNLKWTGNLMDQRVNLVYANGKNEFGSFITIGWMRPGNRLTLGRRYLDENDARCHWSIDELRNATLEKIAVEKDDKITVIVPPWKCDVMHSDIKLKAKKQKIISEN